MIRILSIFIFSSLALLNQTFAQGTQITPGGPDLGGLKIFSAVDLLADFGIENPPADAGRFRVRSFELAAMAPVDTLFDALVNVAGHDESGSIELELHEAYISSSKLIPRTRFKVGRFLLGVGRLNQYHSHDWPFTTAPRAQSLFFATEAAIDTGLEVGHLLDTEIPIDIVAGVTNGWTYGHSHTSGRRPLTATHYLHPTLFFDLGDSRGLQLGVTYLGRTDADSVQLRLSGFDLVYKKRVGAKVDALLQTEFYHRLRTSSTLALEEDVGGYVFGEWSIGEDGWAAGLRLDTYTNLSLKFQGGSHRSNLELGAVPQVSYRVSEFSTFRVSYSFLNQTRQGDSNRNEQRIEVQLIALMGAHPAHEF